MRTLKLALGVLMALYLAPVAKAQDTTAVLVLSSDAGKGSVIDPLQKLYRHNRQGNQAFGQGELEKAMREYVEAQALAPDDPRVLYNLGNTLAQQGKTDDALSVLERAALESGDVALERDARFNRGVVQMKTEDLPAAVRSFAEALTVDPTDVGARRNLELALRKLKEQQQKQQQQDQQQNEKQEQQNQQQEQQNQQQQQENQQQQQNQQQQPQPRDADRDAQTEAARRLLKALESAEKQELKKALKQQIPNLPDRKEDW